MFGIFPERRASFFLLEASLFEDMAALWNSTVGNPLPPTSVEALGSPLEVKRHFALLRSTLRAAFALLEGYLNGLAADIYLTRTDLTQDELTSLTEWDATEERHKTLGFREKVHRYPRIAIASKHPPITESSSRALALLLEAQTRLRHAVIHPTPLGKTDNGVPSREQVHHNLTQDEVADVCDAAIQLILDVSTAIEHRFGGVDWWLKPRAESGLFGNEVFL
ncbi:MAG: hypothetical protein P1P84_21025 [Deferrisomatales bacterium]|nr:hypothetical protein [Deferrisomatales bacterium]